MDMYRLTDHGISVQQKARNIMRHAWVTSELQTNCKKLVFDKQNITDNEKIKITHEYVLGRICCTTEWRTGLDDLGSG